MVSVLRESFGTGKSQFRIRQERALQSAKDALFGSGEVRSFSGGGGISRAQGQGSPFKDPLAAQRAQATKLERERPGIQKGVEQTQAKIDAFNKIQIAINKGEPVPRDAVKFLGLKSTDLIGSRFRNLRDTLTNQQENTNAQIESYNQRVSKISKQIARPTQIEQETQTSLVDRGRNIKLLKKATTNPLAVASFERPEVLTQKRTVQPRQINNLPEGQRAATALGFSPVIGLGIGLASQARQRNLQGQPSIIDTFVKESGTAVFGDAGTETGQFQSGEGQIRTLPFLTRKGGAAERAGSAFFGITGYGREVGERVGGPIGGFVGGLISTPIAGFAGAFEAGPGTAIRALQKGAVEPTFGEFAGDVYGLAGDLVVLPRGAVTTAAKGTSVFSSLAPKALKGLSALEKGQSIYAGAPLTNFLAINAPKILSGAKTVAKIGKKPVVYFPTLAATSILAPEVSEGLVKASFGKDASAPGVEQTIQRTTERAQEIQGASGFKLPEFNIGGLQLDSTTGGLGAGLGFGVLGENRKSFGGLSRSQVKKVALEEAKASGLSGAQAERAAKIATESFFARQLGGLTGLLSTEVTTELAGRSIIGTSIKKSLTGQAVGIGTKQALKKTFTTTAKTIPAFAGLGFYEGIVGQATSDLLTRRTKSVTDLPQAVASDPFRFGIAGLAGAVSAPLIGGTVIAGGTFKTLKRGSKIGAGVEKGFLGAGYALDPLEQPGDFIAGFIGPNEPSFRIRTVTGTSTQEARPGVKISKRTPVSILEPLQSTSVKSPSVIERGAPSIYSGTPTSVENSIFNLGTPSPQSINNVFSDFVPEEEPDDTPQKETDIEDVLEQEVPATESVFSISTGVPVSKSGIPPFFPFLPGAGGGRGRGSRQRKTFFNEFFAATSLLGPRLRKSARTRTKSPNILDSFLKPRTKKRTKTKKRRR